MLGLYDGKVRWFEIEQGWLSSTVLSGAALAGRSTVLPGHNDFIHRMAWNVGGTPGMVTS